MTEKSLKERLLLNTVAASDVYKQKLLTDVATAMVAIDNIKKDKKEEN